MKFTSSQMIERLAARGLVPCEHNLTIWQCPEDGDWHVAIQTPYKTMNVEARGRSLRDALKNLMTATNR